MPRVQYPRITEPRQEQMIDDDDELVPLQLLHGHTDQLHFNRSGGSGSSFPDSSDTQGFTSTSSSSSPDRTSSGQGNLVLTTSGTTVCQTPGSFSPGGNRWERKHSIQCQRNFIAGNSRGHCNPRHSVDHSQFTIRYRTRCGILVNFAFLQLLGH